MPSGLWPRVIYPGSYTLGNQTCTMSDMAGGDRYESNTRWPPDGRAPAAKVTFRYSVIDGRLVPVEMTVTMPPGRPLTAEFIRTMPIGSLAADGRRRQRDLADWSTRQSSLSK